MEVGITFARMVAVRDGRITILEALEGGGTVAGELGPLMLLGGMEESPELHAAELACGPSGPVLAAHGGAPRPTGVRRRVVGPGRGDDVTGRTVPFELTRAALAEGIAEGWFTAARRCRSVVAVRRSWPGAAGTPGSGPR